MLILPEGESGLPVLPSGKVIEISNEAILEPGTHWNRCPPGHFWYLTPDMETNPPPFDSSPQELAQDYAHAPIPRTGAEAMNYIYVLHRRADGAFSWHGEWLSEYPRPGDLTEEDAVAWRAWLHSEELRQYLEKTLEKCRLQAEVNEHFGKER
jgi:hypothetical protein